MRCRMIPGVSLPVFQMQLLLPGTRHEARHADS